MIALIRVYGKPRTDKAGLAGIRAIAIRSRRELRTINARQLVPRSRETASGDCSISTVPVVGAVPGYVVDHDTWRQSWKLIAVPCQSSRRSGCDCPCQSRARILLMFPYVSYEFRPNCEGPKNPPPVTSVAFIYHSPYA